MLEHSKNIGALMSLLLLAGTDFGACPESKVVEGLPSALAPKAACVFTIVSPLVLNRISPVIPDIFSVPSVISKPYVVCIRQA
jgi:hypothetical protein